MSLTDLSALSWQTFNIPVRQLWRCDSSIVGVSAVVSLMATVTHQPELTMHANCSRMKNLSLFFCFHLIHCPVSARRAAAAGKPDAARQEAVSSNDGHLNSDALFRKKKNCNFHVIYI